MHPNVHSSIKYVMLNKMSLYVTGGTDNDSSL